MSRNANSHFATLPHANIQRSKFKRPSRLLTAFNSGKLVPIYLEKMVLPGDTHSLRTTISIRMSTPIHPVMDDAYLDIYYFFVPNRLIWENFEEFMGENKGSYWTNNQPTFLEPHLTFTQDNQPLPALAQDSLYDYFANPLLNNLVSNSNINSDAASCSALPFRAYAKIWNDWFRSEITDVPCVLHTDSQDRLLTYTSDNGYVETAELGGQLCPVSKFHDYFTSALPEPQRGPDVLMPMAGQAPVISGERHDVTGSTVPTVYDLTNGENIVSPGNLELNAKGRLFRVPTSASTTGTQVMFDSLYADLSLATAASINQLREALALQTFFEANARYGTRYTELLRGHFGVTSPDARLQRPEYIGGKRIRLNMNQVLQTSSTDAASPQGNTAAYSWTVDSSDSFTYSAVEHGMIIGLACVRTNQTYQFGFERSMKTRHLTDYYFPEFAHIGEQPIFNYELYAQGTDEDMEVFGYQEAWGDHRYKPSRITGVMRSNAQQSLDVWHYGEDLTSLPTLSSEFMHQSPDVIDRTLAVQSASQPQFLFNADFDMTSVRPMPMYSIPGLASHF